MSAAEVLRDILNNALEEARRHMPSKRRISAWVEPSQVIITAQNTIDASSKLNGHCELIDKLGEATRTYDALISQGKYCPEETLAASRKAMKEAEKALRDYERVVRPGRARHG